MQESQGVKGGVRQPQPPRIGPAPLSLFVLAQIGSFLSFVPLLAILLPLKAQAIGGADKASALALVTICGSVMAFFANPIAGSISDRTRSRWGRRRPWIVAGAVGTVISYAVIALANSLPALVLGFVLFQLTFNFLFAPLNAVVPDRIPDDQKGSVSGLIGLGLPVGSVLGVTLIGRLIDDSALRFVAIAVILLISVLPFALFVREDVPIEAERAAALPLWDFRVNPRKHPDFAWAWLARFLVMIPYSLVTGYMLYYLQDAVRYQELFPGAKAEQGLATLTAISTFTSVVSTLAGGFLSDRLGRRKIFVLAAGATMAGAMAIFALFPTWPGMIVGYAFFGLGIGCFFAVDIALIAQVLPPGGDAGKHLGIINLTNIFGQTLAPLVAVQVLGATDNNYPMLFGIAAVIALTGAVLVKPIRGVN
ncbi:MFS transporter [Sphingopyxis sp.]|jgi:MFS family permease|uniref:MFS transporter n=1 Tax=Sphingopyxis sp. TaxID=1908224 RepID=UPI002DF2A426|nr:MFS transporter [Sphingopyxis sp.]